MSFGVQPALVTSILLADGWHDINLGSMIVDALSYEVVTLHGESIPLTGDITGFFALEGEGSGLAGPLTSVLAVRVIS